MKIIGFILIAAAIVNAATLPLLNLASTVVNRASSNSHPNVAIMAAILVSVTIAIVGFICLKEKS